MTTVFSEAGSVLSAINRSEKTRDKAIAAGIERHNGKHHDRVQKLLAECSPEARALVLSHMRKQDDPGPSSGDAAEGNEAGAAPSGAAFANSPQPDQPGSTTWLDAQPPPLTGVIAKDRTDGKAVGK